MTELEAVNKALTLLGVANITSLSQNIQAARVMNGLLSSARFAVLSEFPWSFALRLRPLVPSDVPAPPGWEYTFDYPAGAAALYNIYGETMTKLPFIVQDGVICTHSPALNVEYTAPVDLINWPPPAAEAYIVRLASDAAAALTGSQQLAISLLEKYGLLIGMAKQNSSNEDHIPRILPTHYIDVRY